MSRSNERANAEVGLDTSMQKAPRSALARAMAFEPRRCPQKGCTQQSEGEGMNPTAPLLTATSRCGESLDPQVWENGAGPPRLGTSKWHFEVETSQDSWIQTHFETLDFEHMTN